MGDGVGGVNNGVVYCIKCLFRVESRDDFCVFYFCGGDFYGGVEIF